MKRIKWVDFTEPDSIRRKARKFIRAELDAITNYDAHAEVYFDRRDKWDGKPATIYRVAFYNKDGRWVGNSYIAVIKDGDVDYDPLS